TYYGHMNVWGTGRWCDFRCRADADMAAVIALAHENNGLCSINHPKMGGPAWEYSTDLPVDAIEVWQGPWPHGNGESLALWDELLRQGRRLPAVGGSDYHCPSGKETNFLRLGQPTTWVKVAERSVSGILDAIGAGRTCISAFPDGPRLEFQAEASGVRAHMGEILSCQAGEPAHVTITVHNGAGYTLHLVTEAGIAHETTIRSNLATVSVNVPAKRYIRAELVGDMSPDRLPENAPAGLDLRQWRWALSNPVYIRQSAV
ncbi:MAG TPA: CehA/McbA family metallohydrolase, partial [Anaerolineae bacterium]